MAKIGFFVFTVLIVSCIVLGVVEAGGLQDLQKRPSTAQIMLVPTTTTQLKPVENTAKWLNDGNYNEAANPNASPQVTDELVADAVKAWTQPEFGSAGKMRRWTTTSVDVYLTNQSSGGQDVAAEAQKALAWVSATTGVELKLSNNPNSQIKITIKDQVKYNNKVVAGHTDLQVSGYNIQKATVQLSSIGYRQVWEELTQMMGPIGDWGPDNASVWANNDRSITRPSAFDAWALRTGYKVNPTSGATGLRALLVKG